ncbi:hypothetical protein ACFLQ6_09060 [Thermoproteota archaeon]
MSSKKKNRVKSSSKGKQGGSRAFSGRRSRYNPIVLDYEIDEKRLVTLLQSLPKWILEDKISVLKARSLVFALRALAEVGFKMKELIERLMELQKIAEIKS